MTITPESLSQETLAEIRRRCDRATRGPWISYVEGRRRVGGDNVIKRGDGEEEDLRIFGGTSADQVFIAHARQDIPLLLDEIERLQARIRELGGIQAGVELNLGSPDREG
ncbi:MAG TPA: hypothetical protein PKG95_07550 [Anaerolineaceae bacterium]|jgi:hypothetical protein|nr:hypothetical protein [Anaerolineaceae bacterium]